VRLHGELLSQAGNGVAIIHDITALDKHTTSELQAGMSRGTIRVPKKEDGLQVPLQATIVATAESVWCPCVCELTLEQSVTGLSTWPRYACTSAVYVSHPSCSFFPLIAACRSEFREEDEAETTLRFLSGCYSGVFEQADLSLASSVCASCLSPFIDSSAGN